MNQDLHLAVAQVEKRLLEPRSLVKATAGGTRKGSPAPAWLRVELRPVELQSGSRLQISTFDERQAFTNNYEWGEPAQHAVQQLLSEPFGHWHVASTDGEYGFRLSKSGKVLVTTSPTQRAQQTEHDREKNRLVPVDAPFLQVVGITSAGGELKPTKTAKYRQVEEFVRLLDVDLRDEIRAGRLSRRPLRIADLGCGNAYLTFAAVHHIHETLGLDAELIGVDNKQQAKERNEKIATELGWSDRVTFEVGDIADIQLHPVPDVVLALHACDTATDDALARALEWKAQLVLAAPCCHHDIQRQLKREDTPPPYGLVTQHGLLRERWGDVLTDALRAAILRQQGYRCDVVEFVGSRHTPRNAMLRAHCSPVSQTPMSTDYDQLLAEWGVRPRLAELLRGR